MMKICAHLVYSLEKYKNASSMSALGVYPFINSANQILNAFLLFPTPVKACGKINVEDGYGICVGSIFALNLQLWQRDGL